MVEKRDAEEPEANESIEVESNKKACLERDEFDVHFNVADAPKNDVKSCTYSMDHPIVQHLVVTAAEPPVMENNVWQLNSPSFVDVCKNRLVKPFQDLNGPIAKKARKKDDVEDLEMTPLQSNLFHFMNKYSDLMFACNDIVTKKPNKFTDKEVRHVYALHCLNHVFKTRDRILKTNAKLSASESVDEDAIRDQGFTRPKVLILLPFRHQALELVKELIELSGTTEQENKKRFMTEFGGDVAASSKPQDHQKLFGGNVDDCFKVGLKFSRKQMKIYADFYSSDIIIASPLGLKMIIGEEGDKKRDFDFLSSIEIVILDYAHVFLMQNWSHVLAIFKVMNLIPKEAHGCDFSRTRPWYLDGKANLFRQTMLFSDYLTPELQSIFNSGVNTAGKVRMTRVWEGSICRVLSHIPQLFQRLPAPLSRLEAATHRFNYFVDKVWSNLQRSATQQSHNLIVVPSYFDFVRLRNYFKAHDHHVGAVSEYCSRSKADFIRHGFAKGEIPFMMMTERYYFFRRHQLKGVKHLVFYGPPINSHFYSELINRMSEEATGDMSSLMLYDLYDSLALERIVGTHRVSKLIKGQKDAHLFSQ